jgi:hypothetical protein
MSFSSFAVTMVIGHSHTEKHMAWVRGSLALCGVLVGSALTGCVRQALTDGDAMAIDAAVAKYLRPSLPSTGVAFETRTKIRHEWVESRSSARVVAFATALRAVPVHHDTVYVCSGDPSTCALRNVRTLLSFTNATITGTTAVVRVSRLDCSGYKRIPVTGHDFELHLVRDGKTWRVASQKELRIT